MIPAFQSDYLGASRYGANWHIQFHDAEGSPLNMLSFEVIDFGGISYKEIFQNVKTILATPLMSAVLERTLGVDSDIVDLPLNRAAEATVAIIDALYFWEPRAQVVDLQFSTDALDGHLHVNLQLRIQNVIYGTNTAYEQTNIYPPPTIVPPQLPIGEIPEMIPGPPGQTGQRGSIWFVDTVDPDASTKIVKPLIMDVFLNVVTGDVFQLLSDFSGGGSRKPLWKKLSP